MGGALPIELWRHIISSFACRTQSRCIRNFRGRMPRYSLHAVPRSCKVWHSRQGSNLQPAVLETAAPSLELREYKTPPLESNQPCLHTRAALQTALRRPYKTALVLRQGCCLTHIPSGSLPTPSGIQSFLSWHGRLSVQLCGGCVHAPSGAKPWSRTTRRGRCAPTPGHSEPPPCEWSRSKISHRSSPRNVVDLYLRTAQGRNVRGLNCIGWPFRLCRYYYNTTDSAQVSMMSTVEKCHELLCKTVKITERCIRPYLCQLTKALRNGSGDRPRV